MAPSSTRPLWPLRLLVVCFVTCTAVWHLWSAAQGHTNYRAQHLGTALRYAEGRIDLLRPVIVGFNANEAPTALEFPIWQAAAALLFKAFGTWTGWANVASLLFLLAGLWPLFQLARRYLGERGAWWALVFFTAQPNIVLLGGRGGTDGSCLVLTLWFVYFAERLLRELRWKWFVGALVFGALSAVTKAPFFFAAGLALVFLLLAQRERRWGPWVALSSVGVLATATFAVWMRHAYGLAALAEFPLVDVRFSARTGDMTSAWWYFGDWSYRLDPRNWIKGAWRFTHLELGGAALVGLLGAGFLVLRGGLAVHWFAAGAVATLVFSHLVLHHGNYYLMFSPAVAMLFAAATLRLEDALQVGARVRELLFCSGAALVLALSCVQSLIVMEVGLEADPYPHRIARLIREHTNESDKLLVQGDGWGGGALIRAGRRGLSIWTTQFLEKPENLARIRELGFTKLVMISESPLLAAVQQINPGQAERKRQSYRDAMTPVVADWPTLIENEDILIKAIPAASP
ncbi:MAG: glycosyltransferase family 39 protein [Verrucomicrobiales bacterium]|nr:glycosyltransferase family 39 protein [Verrucomicrobiales bacterium]